jgi:hypothetical protein
MLKNKKTEFIKYVEQINSSANETQKKERFISFLERIFSDNEKIRPIIDKITSGAEKHLIITRQDKKSSRYADTQYENTIIEFENNLKKTEEHAKDQLLEYLSGIYNAKNKFDYKLISSDGLKWIVYYFDISEVRKNKIDWRNNKLLKEKEVFTVTENNYEDFYYFISKHLFQDIVKNPTLKNFLDDFGVTSNLFANCFKELNDVYTKIKDDPSVQICFDEWKKYLSIAYNFKINSEETFITHTYISIFTKILTYRILSKDDFIDTAELEKILNGTIFYQLNVQNFTEKDFFCWASTKKNISKIVTLSKYITNEINNYNFDVVNEDILKGIYQEFMDTDSKKALGEYYTPDWLCEMIVENLDIKKDNSIIDPSCGSGSFLRASINKLIKLNLSAEEISKKVYGLDIHPLSVLISKTTILLALKDHLKNLEKPLTLNVYMTNTLLPPFEETLEGSTFNLRINQKKYNLNSAIFEDLDTFNNGLEFCNKLAKLHKGKDVYNNSKFEKSFKSAMNEGDIDEIKIDSFYKIYDGLKRSKDQNRNTIWKFIISNLYRPYFFKNQFDIVLGNPPWFPYRSIKNSEYKEDLKKIGNIYKYLPSDSKNLTHFEIAALFIAHSYFNFFKDKSKLAFVLPRSFFQGSQHENTRNDTLEKISIKEIWDLNNVRPLFKTISCVMFFDNFSPKTKTWKGRVYNGKLPFADMNLIDSKKYINFEEDKFFLSRLQKDTAITTDQTSTYKTNAYIKKFYQGATITPRNFYFFDYNQNKPKNYKNNKVNIKTSELINSNAKKPWKNKKLEGIVSSKHFFLTCLSNSIIPFNIINFYDLILPITKDKDNNISLYTSELMENNGDLDSSRWFKIAEDNWNKFRASKSLNLYTNLNYQNKLTNQNLSFRYIVLYTASSKDVNAALYDRQSNELEFVVESKTYCYFTNNKDEAYYLLSFLNSNYANKMIKNFQTKGDFGHRDIHKRILKVPLDIFNNSNKKHLKIVALSKECEIISKKASSNFDEDNNKLKPLALGKLRLEIRVSIDSNLKKIDKLFLDK